MTANGITNLNAIVSEANNSIQFNVTNDGLISNNTLIENLFETSGLNLNPGVINLTDGAAIDVNIDFSSAATIGEMITAFNTQIASAGVANVQMAINGSSTGLDIVDANGVPLNLNISDTSGGNLAATLGLQGLLNPALFGVDLNPTAHFNVAEAGGTTAEDLGILTEFKHDFLGDDINPVLTLNSALSDFGNGLGLPGGILDIWHGDSNVQIDISDPSIVTVQDFINAISLTGLDIEASINAAGTGIQIVNNDPYRSLTIEDGGDVPVAKELGVYGSSDMVGSFFVLGNALKNDDREAVGLLIENFDEIINKLLSKVAVTGSKAIRLEETKNRLMSQELIFTERLSEVEDADMTKLITDLSTYETNYQAALLAAAKIIQPSLLDFLR
ncbi:MAG: hypothetical protein DWP97_08580 [Calditrichaeota bacterium]|nr:MAG: hypothetical protein DWP97_08580 [Calditrichota bacterium]